MKFFKYRLMLKIFHWITDDDGDVGLVVFNLVTFIKYKESTIVKWGLNSYEAAGKWQGHDDDYLPSVLDSVDPDFADSFEREL